MVTLYFKTDYNITKFYYEDFNEDLCIIRYPEVYDGFIVSKDFPKKVFFRLESLTDKRFYKNKDLYTKYLLNIDGFVPAQTEEFRIMITKYNMYSYKDYLTEVYEVLKRCFPDVYVNQFQTLIKTYSNDDQTKFKLFSLIYNKIISNNKLFPVKKRRLYNSDMIVTVGPLEEEIRELGLI